MWISDFFFFTYQGRVVSLIFILTYQGFHCHLLDCDKTNQIKQTSNLLPPTRITTRVERGCASPL